MSVTSPYNRKQLADWIHEALCKNQASLSTTFKQKGRINSCFLDNVLPDHVAKEIYNVFPHPDEMAAHKSIRENKRVAAQMDLYHPLLEEIIYAFQDDRIVKICEQITGIPNMEPDEHLYAGGISLMAKDNFLNPHLDNSHNSTLNKYRVLNLLYYVTPDWSLENGGHLELWDNGVKGEPRVIESRFNRLALMITNTSSYHSVSQVKIDHKRCCVSNYYFSEQPADDGNYFHVTSFYGRPDEPFKNWILKIDRNLRQFLRKINKKGFFKSKHIYKK